MQSVWRIHDYWLPIKSGQHKGIDHCPALSGTLEQLRLLKREKQRKTVISSMQPMMESTKEASFKLIGRFNFGTNELVEREPGKRILEDSKSDVLVRKLLAVQQ